jgi:hypothetical protein
MNVASPDRVATATASSITHSRGEDAEDWNLVGTNMEVWVFDTEGRPRKGSRCCARRNRWHGSDRAMLPCGPFPQQGVGQPRTHVGRGGAFAKRRSGGI